MARLHTACTNIGDSRDGVAAVRVATHVKVGVGAHHQFCQKRFKE